MCAALAGAVHNRERERRDWEAREEARLAAEAETAARREAHKAAIKELSAQTQVRHTRVDRQGEAREATGSTGNVGVETGMPG